MLSKIKFRKKLFTFYFLCALYQILKTLLVFRRKIDFNYIYVVIHGITFEIDNYNIHNMAFYRIVMNCFLTELHNTYHVYIKQKIIFQKMYE